VQVSHKEASDCGPALCLDPRSLPMGTAAVRLNPLDASWRYTESREAPMHAGA